MHLVIKNAGDSKEKKSGIPQLPEITHKGKDMQNNLFDRLSKAITYMGIFGFVLSIPLYWVVVKVSVGTFLYLPTMATDFQDASLGVPLLFIGLFIILGVWGFFGKKAGIIVSIILACVYWKLIVLILWLLLFLLLPLICLSACILLIVAIVKYFRRKINGKSQMPRL